MARREAERRAVREEAAVREKQAKLAEQNSQIAPAPRVRTLAWAGTDIERATTALPPANKLPPLHANHRKPRNKVAPVAEPVVLAHEVLGEPWSVARALCGTFTLVQTLLGACLGFGITFGIFHLLTAGAPWHDWASDKVLFALLGSPFFTAVFAPMFVPMAMPEAAAKGWIGFVPVERLPPPLQCLPFLRASRALTRHLLLGVAVAALWIPGGLFVLTQLLTPPFSGFTVALFAGCYVVSLSLVVFPIGLLGFLLEPNYDRAISMMSVEENPLTRLVERVLLVPLA